MNFIYNFRRQILNSYKIKKSNFLQLYLRLGKVYLFFKIYFGRNIYLNLEMEIKDVKHSLIYIYMLHKNIEETLVVRELVKGEKIRV